jgi:hypothetical protein
MMAVAQFSNDASSESAPNFWNLFTSDQQRRMIDEDLHAGLTVSMVLFGVLTGGLIGMILSVLLTL